jgi:hypothetical protein
MGPLAKRAGIAAAVLAVFAVGLAVLLRGRRRRRGPHLTLSWR